MKVRAKTYGYVYLAKCDGFHYVGQHCGNFTESYKGKGTKWKQFIKGKTVKVKPLQFCETPEELNNAEKCWIAKYNSPFNIQKGGQSNSIDYRRKMSSTIKAKMNDEYKQKISKSLKAYRKENPFSDEHKKKLSKSMLSNTNGLNNKGRSVKVKCTYNGKEYFFESKRQAAKWWFDTCPVSDKFSEVTYIRKINKSIQKEAYLFMQWEVTK